MGFLSEFGNWGLLSVGFLSAGFLSVGFTSMWFMAREVYVMDSQRISTKNL